ncbi:unnamed protein product [Lactuca saligna]|uniref:Uncharacterized protein n=1 Tax=Lactuca saligna TaxID=75948 RepID=A0AA36E6E4_LACSI|nr:unnamed protein product [Lactuca saligna]
MSSLEDMNIEDQDDDEENQDQDADTSQGFEYGDVNRHLDSPASDKNIADTFAILELRYNVDKVDSKFDIVCSKVTSFDTKVDLVIKTLSKIKVVAPTVTNRGNQFDQVNSLFLSCTLEDANQCYKDNLDHYTSTLNMMLKIHDDMMSATNELTKQTHVHHEKEFKGWRKRSNKKMVLI